MAGQAAVIVSTVNIFKGTYLKTCFLDGTHVNRISAYLFQKGGNEEPRKLKSNAGLSFQGSITYGMGFTFDDNDRKGVASPTSMMEELIKGDKSNAERIFPYLGGDELNTQPNHQHSRFVIFFGDMTLEQASKWPDLLKILELRVKPDRESKASDVANWPWWQFWRSRNELYDRIKNLHRVLLTNAQATPHHCFAFSTSKMVFANSLNVFPFQTCDYFALLQSRVHEVWARSFSSSLKDDLRYNPTDCFETFPMPECLQSQNKQPIQSTTSLDSVGMEYYDFRSKLMLMNNEGLTKTYNRFHDSDYNCESIVKLRVLHSNLDKAVLESYGWNDLASTAMCECLLDYEDEDEGQEPSRRKKPWRFRWPDDFRDEVLARLLELNAQRSRQEILAGQTALSKVKLQKSKPQKTTRTTASLFPDLDSVNDSFALTRDEKIILIVVQYFKLITRYAVDEALILMKSKPLRQAIANETAVSGKTRTTPGLNAVYGGLINRNFLSRPFGTVQQVLSVGTAPWPVEETSSADLEALNEIKSIFDREMDRDTGNVTFTPEEAIDVKPGFVSAYA